MKYAYQRAGGPILDWKTAPPRQSRASETTSLGSLAGSSLAGPTLVLPAPGAPEPVGITRQAMGGCGCSGTSKCGGMGGALDELVDALPGGYITLGVAAFVAFKVLSKKR